jgi:hypothetical protein
VLGRDYVSVEELRERFELLDPDGMGVERAAVPPFYSLDERGVIFVKQTALHVHFFKGLWHKSAPVPMKIVPQSPTVSLH